jgi:hypothetical protein
VCIIPCMRETDTSLERNAHKRAYIVQYMRENLHPKRNFHKSACVALCIDMREKMNTSVLKLHTRVLV